MVPLASSLVKQGGPPTHWTSRFFYVYMTKALLPRVAAFCPDSHVIQDFFFGVGGFGDQVLRSFFSGSPGP